MHLGDIRKDGVQTINEAGASPLTGIKVENGTAQVKGTTNIDLKTNAGKAVGIWATNFYTTSELGDHSGSATANFADVNIDAVSQSGKVYGILATAEKATTGEGALPVLIKVTGDTDIDVSSAKGNAYGVAILKDDVVTLEGNATIKAAAAGEKSEAYSVYLADGTLNLGSEGKTVALTGDALVDGKLNLVNVKGTTTLTGALTGTGELNNSSALTITGALDKFTGKYVQNDGSFTVSAANKFFGGDVEVKGGAFKADKVDVAAGQTVKVSERGTVTLGEVALAGTTDKETKFGTVTVEGGATTIGSLTVNKGATATLASADIKANEAEKIEAFDGFVKVTTATNEGTLTLGDETVVTSLTNKASTTLNAGAEVAALTNKDKATVTVADAADVANLTNEKGGKVLINATLTVAGTSTNEGILGAEGEAVATAGKLIVEDGKLDNKAFINVQGIEIGEGGTLSTSLDPAADVVKTTFTKFKTVEVKKGGTFDVKALNGKFESTAKTNDALVLLGDADMTLSGGNMTVAGASLADKNFRIEDGTVTIKSGDYKVGALAVDNTEGNKLTVEGGSLAIAGVVATTANGQVDVKEKGTLTITAAGIAVDADKDGKLSGALVSTGDNATKLKGTIANAGTVVVTGLDDKTIELGKVATLKNAIVTGAGFVNLGKVSVTLKETDTTKDGNLTATTANALAGVRVDEFKNATVDIGTGATLTGGSFGSLLGSSGASVAENAVLELNNSGLLAQDSKGKAISLTLGDGSKLVTTGADAQIGTVSGDAATLDVASGKLTAALKTAADGDDPAVYHDIKVGTLNVAEGAALESKGAVTVSKNGGKSLIAGTANIDTLAVTGTGAKLDITGAAVVKTIASGAGVVNVGTETATGTLVAETVAGKIFADPAFENGLAASTVAVKTVAADGSVEAGENSYVAVGTTDINVAKAAFAKTGYTLAAEGDKAVQAVVYVAAQKDASGNFTPILGKVAATGSSTATNSLTTGTVGGSSNPTGMMIVDVATVDKTADQTAVFSGDVTNSGILYLANVAVDDQFKIATGTFNGGVIKTASARMIGATATNNQITIGFSDEVEDGVYNGLDTLATTKAAFKNGAVNGGSSSQRFATWLFEEEAINGLVVDGERNDIVEVGNAVAYIGASAGLANVTMDAVAEFNDSVAARTSILAQRGEGVNVWVDVNGGKFEGKKVVDGEVGYSSDLYGAVLGADVTVACGATVGAAITVGTADTDSKGEESVKTSVDTDFVGIGLYANKPIGEVANVAFDLGYVKASNELNVKQYGIGTTDADTDAVTFGVRGELLAKVGAVDVVPHVGLRWTRLSFDQFEAGYVTDIDSMNVFQMPVGVTFKGDVEVSGWNIAPAFDLTFIPTWGDKDIEQKVWVAGSSVKDTLEATRVLDNNVVNATLGVAAQNGAWTFGLDYKLGVGSDDRLNNSFNARVNYAF